MMETQELFENYRVDRVPRWPIMTRLAAGSIVLHAIFILVVLYVPAVRDALNIASIIAGSDYVDRDYKRTQIGDRAVIIELPRDKFRYPDGYFNKEIATVPAPDPFAPVVVATAPPVVPPFANGKRNVITPPVPEASASPSPATPAATTDPTTTTAGTQSEVDRTLDQTAANFNIVRPDENSVNKRPLREWLQRSNELKAQGKLDLSKAVEIVIVAKFDDKGQLTEPPEVVQKSGDPVLSDVAKDMVGAIIDSNALSFLRDPKKQSFETRQLRFTIKMDQNVVMAIVETEVESPERAEQLALGYSLLLKGGEIQKQGQDEEIIYRNTKVTSNGKQIVVNFTLPRQQAGEMLKKQLPPAT